MKTMIELFSGSGKMSLFFQRAGYETFTIDVDPHVSADLESDINYVFLEDIPKKFHNPDVIWCGLDCTYWSRANNKGNHLGKGGVLISKEAKAAYQTLLHTLYLIEQLKPKFWFLENPGGNGGLKQQPIMKNYPMTQIYYCQYGADVQKPTCIWGKFPSKWIPKVVCSCIRHKGNIEDTKSGQLIRSEYPDRLCLDIVNSCLLSTYSSWVKLEDFI